MSHAFLLDPARARDTIMQKRNLIANICRYLLALACPLLVMVASPQPTLANGIYVTTLKDTIGDASGCSLKDAIFASTFHLSIARTGYDYYGTPQYVTTQCVPGNGNDTIILPNNALLQLSAVLDDADNSAGPTATPIITSIITIEAYGATLQWSNSSSSPNANSRAFTVGSTGRLTIRNAHLKGFSYKGGDGIWGSGGGMGAGGAIYVQGGSLTVENSTFDGNVVTGGAGGGKGISDSDSGGGGGGMGGSGGATTGAEIGLTVATSCGGGGGGSRSAGQEGGEPDVGNSTGGGGGGTVRTSFVVGNTQTGGFTCGGSGGNGGQEFSIGSAGADAPCPGGGGGGGGVGEPVALVYTSHDGGNGNYGGGGGGGSSNGGNGGNGGFGGGGGAGWSGLTRWHTRWQWWFWWWRRQSCRWQPHRFLESRNWWDVWRQWKFSLWRWWRRAWWSDFQ